MPRVHTLKTDPEQFAATLEGDKVHETRLDDRRYAVGDLLHLREYDRGTHHHTKVVTRGYTGRSIWRAVTYKTEGGTYELPPGVCVLSLRHLTPEEVAEHVQ